MSTATSITDPIARAKQVDLLGLIEPVTKLRKVAAREYAGPCPRCGGVDRFRVNLDRGWFCRQCQDEEHWHDQIDFRVWYFGESWIDALRKLVGRLPITREDAQRFQHERESRERERIAEENAKRQTARERLQASRLWLTYYANLDRCNARGLWRERGLSDGWQNYYKVGYCPDREWMSGDTRFVCSSLTIPYLRWSAPGEYVCIGLRHRLLAPDAPGGKYRPEFSGLGNNLYQPWYEDKTLCPSVLIVEGEIKAMVTFANLWAGEDAIAPWLSVVGISGKTFKPELAHDFNGVEKIYICLDPDATRNARELAATLGAERCQVVTLPEKIDDLFVMGVLDGYDFLKLLEGY